MSHNWKKNEQGDIDLYAMTMYASAHHGPMCTICGVRFCIDCNPEIMDTDCSQFMS